MQSDGQETQFPLANIAQLLKTEPQGIESGEANFAEQNYVRKQSQEIDMSNIPAVAA